VIVVAPDDDLLEKTISNVQEVAARGGQIILISSADAERAGCVAAHIRTPKAHPFANPLVNAVPIQLIAYHTAVFMGTDVDQPRNLAKSVTVE
jgi:glucosamine--fructose-6-phosphate aminotransferase (isomerizing)